MIELSINHFRKSVIHLINWISETRMQKRLSHHTIAVLQAFLVTFLWSSSFVIIKIGLRDLPALTFAGLRFVLAFLCLMPFCFRQENISQIRKLNRSGWWEILVLGILYYAITPGTQNLGLAFLPANTFSLLLSFTAVVVAFGGMYLLGEKPAWVQWFGMGIYLVGALIYFQPGETLNYNPFGILIGLISMLANSLSALLGRKINREGHLDPILVTALSMGVGSVLLLVTGILVEGWPHLTLLHWAMILWLATINSALAYFLWNKTLIVLPALESTLINNSMLVQIAILGSIFLGESLNALQITGIVIAMIGIGLVQVFRSNPQKTSR